VGLPEDGVILLVGSLEAPVDGVAHAGGVHVLLGFGRGDYAFFVVADHQV